MRPLYNETATMTWDGKELPEVRIFIAFWTFSCTVIAFYRFL